MRSIWKGHIRFSLVTIPVRIYNAVETSESIRFNQLHRECNGRVGYDKKCKKCEKSLATEDIVKGYEYEPDRYVVLESNDFEKVRLKSTKVIEIAGFVDAGEVDPVLFESPYFAGPDGEVAAKSYTLLSKALKDTNRVGVGKVTLRDREDVVLIAPAENGLILYRLRYPNEVRKLSNVPQMDTLPAVENDQLKLARSLVDTMTMPFSSLDLIDTYSTALKEIINAKIAGQEIVAVQEEEKPVVDIMTALKESIEMARSRVKPMEKAAVKEKKKSEEEVEAKPAKAKKRKTG